MGFPFYLSILLVMFVLARTKWHHDSSLIDDWIADIRSETEELKRRAQEVRDKAELSRKLTDEVIASIDLADAEIELVRSRNEELRSSNKELKRANDLLFEQVMTSAAVPTTDYPDW